MADALVDRILRLAVHETTPYTALSLLKAYISFKEGLCLRRSGSDYTCYAAIGLESDEVCLSAERLAHPAPQIPAKVTAASIGLSCMDGDSDLWLYSLDQRGDALLLLTENEGSPLDAGDLEAVLAAVRQKFLPPAAPGKSDALEAFLRSSFASSRGGASLLVMGGNGIDDAAETLETLLSSAGTLRRLAGDRLLIVLPDRLDAELIGHRLRKSLGLTVVAAFPAAGTEEAARLLAPYA